MRLPASTRLRGLSSTRLQEVDAWPDTGLLLAATNQPYLVDPALWRRFDSILTFEMSDPSMLQTAVRRFLSTDAMAFEPFVHLLAASLHGHSLADVERAVSTLRQNPVPGLTTVGRGGRASERFRRRLCVRAHTA